MGKYDSSKTRIEPFFTALRARDKTGNTWLPQLLSIVPNQQLLTHEVVNSPGSVTELRFGQELKLHPPEAFLRWLLQNPARMTWPKKRFSQKTQDWRKRLIPDDIGNAPDRELDIADAMKEGLESLATKGAIGSKGKYWAFEGFTSVDCFIATDRVHLFIEGKRTEDLSRGTDWYPKRNQLMRNLESAHAYSTNVPFGCLLMVEKRIDHPSEAGIRDSLPHLSTQERHELLTHLLGQITWSQACEATGLDYSEVFAGHV